MPLIANLLKPFAKSVLTLLGLTIAAAAKDAANHKRMFRSGNATLIISIEEMTDIVKIVNSLENFGLLIKGVSENIKNEAKEIKRQDFSVCYQKR